MQTVVERTAGLRRHAQQTRDLWRVPALFLPRGSGGGGGKHGSALKVLLIVRRGMTGARNVRNARSVAQALDGTFVGSVRLATAFSFLPL